MLRRADNNLWIDHNLGQFSLGLTDEDFVQLRHFFTSYKGSVYQKSIDLGNRRHPIRIMIEQNGEDVNIWFASSCMRMIVVCPRSEVNNLAQKLVEKQ